MQNLITKTITIILMAAAISTVLVGCATHKCCNGSGGGISAMPFGADKDGVAVKLFTLRNHSGTEATICNYGGLVTSLKVADRNGNFGDVTLGYDTLAGYIKDTPYFGALIGRYGNRIAKGKFSLEGNDYKLATNNGVNALHGGLKGFDKVVWSARSFEIGRAHV